MAKVPGAKPVEKPDVMLDPALGIGSNGIADTPWDGLGDLPKVTFAADHQLPCLPEGQLGPDECSENGG